MSIILKRIKNLGILRPPKPIVLLPDRCDRNKICEFHQDHGHTTNECMTLKGWIHALIRNNLLMEYLAEKEDQEKEKNKLSSSARDRVRVIAAIHKGTDQQNSSSDVLYSR